jgi:hypothetical protein
LAVLLLKVGPASFGGSSWVSKADRADRPARE